MLHAYLLIITKVIYLLYDCPADNQPCHKHDNIHLLNLLIGTYAEAGEGSTFGGITQMTADLYGVVDEPSWNGSYPVPSEFILKNVNVDNWLVRANWANSYEVINKSNLILDNLEIITSSDQLRLNTEAEAKFLRALCYFNLVRLFALPYEADKSNSQLGLPLRLFGITDFNADLSIARSNVEDVYDLIINDLTQSSATLPETNTFFADKYAVKALLARVFFQQGNYTEARTLADDVIQNSGHSLASSFYLAFNNDEDGLEDIFAFQVTDQDGSNDLIRYYASQENGGLGGDIALEDSYFALFDDPDNDVRADFVYISPDNGLYLTSKYTNQYGNVPIFRMAEMHLIRAESNFRSGTTLGLDPLTEINMLRNRSNASPLGALTLDLIFNERQLELGFEGHLIHDYKRTQRSIGEILYNDNRLVLPIPLAEMNTNPLMEQNPGYTN